MRTKRPKWQWVAIAFCTVWIVMVLAQVWHAVRTTRSFEQAAAESCGQFLISTPVERLLLQIDRRIYFPVISWKDARSGDVITTIRHYEKVGDCDVMERRSKMFLASARTGVIVPQVTVNLRRLMALIGIPCCILYILSYLLFVRRTRNPAQRG